MRERFDSEYIRSELERVGGERLAVHRGADGVVVDGATTPARRASVANPPASPRCAPCRDGDASRDGCSDRDAERPEEAAP